jgi:hypothetical protein
LSGQGRGRSWIAAALLALLTFPADQPAAAPFPPERIAERTFERSWPASAFADVEIKIARGRVVVHGGEGREIRLRARLGAGVEALEVRRADQWVAFAVEAPIEGPTDDMASELEVWLPAASTLDVAAPAADVEIEGVAGKVAVRTLSGALVLRGAPSDVFAQSTSGAFALDVVSPLVMVKNVAGAVRIAGAIEELRVETVSGRLDLEAAVGDEAHLATAEGEIEVRGEIGEVARLRVETLNGIARLRLPAALEGRFHLRSFQGELVNELGPAFERPGPRREVRWQQGRSPRRIEVETFAGRIELLRR